jgi:hypothetical protein
MLNAEAIQKLATVLKIDAEDFKAKLSSEKEEELTLADLKVFTDSELESRITNERATAYNDGKVAQEEMIVKKAKKDLGYEFDGKNFETFLDHHSNQLKTKYSKDSSSRVTELEADMKKLQDNYQTTIQEKESQLGNYKSQLGKISLSNQLLSIMPKDTTIAKEDVITLFNANYEVVEEEGQTFIKKGGQTIKDETTLKPLGLKDVFNNFVTERKYVSGTPGRGGSTEYGQGGSKANSISQFNSDWEKSGKQAGTPEYNKAYITWRQENKEVVA